MFINKDYSYKYCIIITAFIIVCNSNIFSQENSSIDILSKGVYRAFVNDSPPVSEVLYFNTKDSVVYRSFNYGSISNDDEVESSDYLNKNEESVKYKIIENRIVFDFNGKSYQCIIGSNELTTVVYDGSSKKRDQVRFVYKAFID